MKKKSDWQKYNAFAELPHALANLPQIWENQQRHLLGFLKLGIVLDLKTNVSIG